MKGGGKEETLGGMEEGLIAGRKGESWICDVVCWFPVKPMKRIQRKRRRWCYGNGRNKESAQGSESIEREREKTDRRNERRRNRRARGKRRDVHVRKTKAKDNRGEGREERRGPRAVIIWNL